MNKVFKAKAEDIFAMAEHLFNNGNTVWIVVSGMSMYPFLREDIDMVELARTGLANIKNGDIVLIKRVSGEFVLHRVIKKSNSGIFIMGDAQQWIEGPVSEDQLKAVAINISRSSRIISCNNFMLKTLVRSWMLVIPIRYKLIKAFGVFSKLTGRTSIKP